MKKLQENNINTHSQILFNHHFCDGNNTKQNSTIQTLLNGQPSCTFFRKPCPVERLKCIELFPGTVCLQFNWYDINRPSLKDQMSNWIFDGLKMHLDLSDTFNWPEDYITKRDIKGVVIKIGKYGKTSLRDQSQTYTIKPGGIHVLKLKEERVNNFSH